MVQLLLLRVGGRGFWGLRGLGLGRVPFWGLGRLIPLEGRRVGGGGIGGGSIRHGLGGLLGEERHLE